MSEHELTIRFVVGVLGVLSLFATLIIASVVDNWIKK